MATAVCPSCQAAVPGGATQCPCCGYAGTIRPPKGAITFSPSKSRLAVGLVAVTALLGRCGFQLLRNADTVADVASFASGDPFAGDDVFEQQLGLPDDSSVGASWSIDPGPPVDPPAPGEHRLLGGSGSLRFPVDAALDRQRVSHPDGRVVVTVSDGVRAVREVLLPAGEQPDGHAGLRAELEELAAELGAALATDEEADWQGHTAHRAHLDSPTAAYDVLALVLDSHYVELWCSGPPGSTSELDAFAAGLELRG
jgi:hypothetical protein